MLSAGCAVNNNYMQPDDFAERLRKDGVEVAGSRPLPPDPFRATSGAAIRVGNGEIGVYKFDNTISIQKKRLEQIAGSRRLYINGIPYPVVVHGSFVFMGLEKNSKKHVKTARSYAVKRSFSSNTVPARPSP